MYQSGGVRTQNFSLFIECSPTYLSLRWGPYPDQSITIIEKNYVWHNVTGWPGWWQEAQICRNLQLRRKQVRRLKFWHGMVEYQGIGVSWELVSAWVDPPVRGAAGENLIAWPALNKILHNETRCCKDHNERLVSLRPLTKNCLVTVRPVYFYLEFCKQGRGASAE